MPLDTNDTIERLREDLAKWPLADDQETKRFAKTCAEVLPFLLDVVAATKKHCDADVNDDVTKDEAHDEMHDAVAALDKFEKTRKP